MTLDEMTARLPSVLHDGGLRTLAIDYTLQQATFGLNICVGDPEATTEAEREAYQAVTLTISGLLWCVIECPENADSAAGDELWIDAGLIDSLKERPMVPAVPDRAFAWWIFGRPWNAFIYVAGRTASIG
jgi:hypothetical protein